MTLKKLFLLLLAFMLVFASCTTKEEGEPTETATGGQTEEATETEKTGLSGTLTIAATTMYSTSLKSDIKMFKILHPNVEIILDEYEIDQEYELNEQIYTATKYAEQLGVKLMSNASPPDIIQIGITNNFLPYRDYAEKGFLVDLYDLINNEDDPAFQLNAFRQSALEALEVNKGLYMYPYHYLYTFYAINENAPKEAIEEFNKLENGATILDLANIYNKYNNSDMLFANHSKYFFSEVCAQLINFIDFEKKTCNFGDDFIDLLNVLKKAYELGSSDYGVMISQGFNDDIEEARKKYFFQSVYPNFLAEYMLSSKTGFINAVPLVSNNGEMIIRIFYSYAIINKKNNENKELAWEFIKFLNRNNAAYLGIEIIRNNNTEKVLTDIFTKNNSELIEKYTKIIDMPKVYEGLNSRYYLLIEPVLDNFFYGSATAEQVAKSLQNTFSIMLQE